MATIVFYAKPNCVTNARQRKLLEAAGHRVEWRNLLTEPWTAERLRAFFDGLPVPEWFNRFSPRIRGGTIHLDRLSPERALALLMSDPLLIKRPLLEIDEIRIAGFDPQRLQCLDLQAADVVGAQGCSHLSESTA